MAGWRKNWVSGLFGSIDFLDKYNYDKVSPGKKFKGIAK
jgi:hypothetical protein